MWYGKNKFDFDKNPTDFEIYSYLDTDGVVGLKIIKSGWDKLYHCMIEWGEYEDVSYNLLTKEQIKEKYDIEVNKCNDCQHEWKKEKYHWVGTSEIIESKLDTVYYYLWGIGQSKKVKFDENDLTEKFNSLQEKRAFECNKAMSDSSWRIDKIKKDWGNYSIELITKLLDEHHSHKDYIEFGIDLELIFKTKLGLKHIDEFIKDEL